MDPLGDVLDRPKSYYNIDGVGELGVSFMLLAFALLQWLQLTTPEDALPHRLYFLAAYVGSMCLIIHYGSKAIKNRITYPRTGFVEYRKRYAWRASAISAVFAASFAVALAFVVRQQWNLATAASLAGLFVAASYAYGIARFVAWKWIVASAMALTSVAVPTFVPAQPPGLAGYVQAEVPIFAAFGIILLISGGISFWLYIRNTSRGQAE